MPEPITRLKRAELTSTVGAGVLGAGLGLLLDQTLRPHVVAILLVGLLMHGWGMYDKHQLESSIGTAVPRWTEWLYWGCWLGLLGLGVYIGLR
jgi:hypothetical protein